MSFRADLVTVYHGERNYTQHLDLHAALARHEPSGGYRFIGVDNRIHNRGFAAACNLGAFHPQGDAPIVGFLNPDVVVAGPFLDRVEETLVGDVTITGCRYDKPAAELATWGVREWVCGAAMFVNRKWFTKVGGFDTQFVWSHDDTDLIRTAEAEGLVCAAIDLPIRHASPDDDTPTDTAYKRYHFAQAQRRFIQKWQARG